MRKRIDSNIRRAQCMYVTSKFGKAMLFVQLYANCRNNLESLVNKPLVIYSRNVKIYGDVHSATRTGVRLTNWSIDVEGNNV